MGNDFIISIRGIQKVDNDFDEIEFDYCKLFDEPCEDVRSNNRCTYKLKQQIQQLKAENDRLIDELDKLKVELKDMTLRKIDYLKESLIYKQTLIDIKDFVENEMVPNIDTHIILQLISEVEDEN